MGGGPCMLAYADDIGSYGLELGRVSALCSARSAGQVVSICVTCGLVQRKPLSSSERDNVCIDTSICRVYLLLILFATLTSRSLAYISSYASSTSLRLRAL